MLARQNQENSLTPTGEQSEALHEQAERCRRLAGATYNREVRKALGKMAEDFDRSANELARRPR